MKKEPLVIRSSKCKGPGLDLCMVMSEKLKEVSMAGSRVNQGKDPGGLGQRGPLGQVRGGVVGPSVHLGIYPVGDGAIGKL